MTKFTVNTVRALRAPGRYGDGKGLWLQVTNATQRSWLFRYTMAGRARAMGLGSTDDVSLAQARDAAEAARKLIRDGIDPIEHRRAAHRATVQQEVHTFADAARLYIAAQEAAWKNPSQGMQWRNSLANYADKTIGHVPCADVTTDHVLAILGPIWASKSETASRVRSRIEAILSYATMRGWRAGPNPAVWRGHLALALPAKGKVAPVEHFAALDWREVRAFMHRLRQQEGRGAAALEFVILTAARPTMARGATWEQIDFGEAVWTVPGWLMKSGKPHRVPLSKPALLLLEEMRPLRIDDASIIFPGTARSDGRAKPLSDMTLSAVLKRMDLEVTVHGFRSTFRTWTAEVTDHPEEVAKAALAHTISDKVDAAYQRGTMFEKRRVLMDDWAAYLARPPAEIIPLPPAPTARVAARPAAVPDRGTRRPGAA